jgi:CRP-like cAMP-binding protein
MIFMDKDFKAGVQFLKNVPLFSGLSDRQLARIFALAVKKDFLENEPIFDLGSQGYILYVIKDGLVRLKFKDLERVVNPCDVFGEDCLAGINKRPAAASALKNSEIYLIYSSALTQVMESDGQLGMTIMKNIISKFLSNSGAVNI